MTATPPLKVLCVDDNRDAATTLATVLGLVGHDARCTFDGAEGLRVARQFRPDVFILDIHMPGMSGCDLAEQLRQEFGKGVLLVALTAVPRGEFAERIDRAGFDWLLVKPATADDLIRVLGEFAASRTGLVELEPAAGPGEVRKSA